MEMASSKQLITPLACPRAPSLGVHYSNCFTGLLNGNEAAIYADSAYQSQAHTQWLKGRHIENRIIKRAYRNRPHDKKAKQFNRIHSGVRCTVERVFGVLK